MDCEDLVKTRLIKSGYKFCWQRQRTPFAEIDLCVQSPNGVYHLIEVKSVCSSWQQVISTKQRQRLEQAYIYMLETMGECRMHLAMVDGQGKVRFVADFLEV